MHENSTSDIYTINIEQKQTQEKVDLQLVIDRKNQLQRLESDMVDLNSMFKDLAVIVHDQGELIGYLNILII